MQTPSLKSFLKPILYLVLFFVILTCASKFGAVYAVIAFLAILAAIYIAKRASILSLMATFKFKKDKQKAFDLFEKAYKTGKMKPQTALYYSYLLLRDGRLEESDKKFDEILSQNKKALTETDINNVHLNKTLVKWKSGDLKGALADAQSLYDNGYKTTALYGVLGYWYDLDGQYEKALEVNKEAYDYNSDDLIIADNLAQNYFLLGDIEKSHDMYVDILNKDPQFIEPYYNFALVLDALGEYDDALCELNNALEMKEKFLSTVTHDMVRAKIEEIKNKKSN
ncbi:tetratricopeptide repeat protein [Qingrenia yutianensis]|uniref:Tetratricopeptide repeat protein n=1 Tax=Qingrenia yutianensis TaxID=2763676 RepID=A0A926F757_9FIRM|nr:hypothetical protein [Qingrenia yutianensis]MBC8597048.1 hypothetical protein [Qingrenia yutianensis]